MTGRGGTITREGERYPPAPHELEYLPFEPPEPGESQPLAEGLLWLRIPLPMELTHINVWLLEDGDGWLLVDTGMAEDVCREAWLRLEERSLDGRPLRRIFVTTTTPITWASRPGSRRATAPRSGCPSTHTALPGSSSPRIPR